MTRTNQKIPEGWSVKKLGEMGKFVSGGTPDTEKPEYWNGDIIWLTPSEITKLPTRFVSDSERKITRAGLKNSSAVLLPVGSLIICTRATVGDCCINIKEVSTNQGFKNLIPENSNIDFLYYMISSHKTDLIRKACGSTFLEISKHDIEKLKYSVPPLSEQEKIAEILGTWDLAIEKLTALIEQKKLLKKGLMQRLLTGKQRLPGFSTPWKKFEFDAIFYTEKGIKNKQIQTKEYQTKGRFPIVDQGKQKIIAYTDDENKLYKCTPVIVFGDHTRILKFITFHFVIGADGTQLIKTYSEYSLVFCFYVLQNISIPNLGYSRHMSVLKEKVFNLPPLPEQKAIADILSKADEEIDLLTRKLSALKEQKTGLMQQLLTGKIRVKLN